MILRLLPGLIVASTLLSSLAGAQEVPREAPPAQRPAAPVLIEADADDFTWLTVGHYTCRLPCRVRLPNGVYPVIASGRRNWAGHLEMGDAPLQLELKDASASYRVAGAVMIPVGVVMASTMWSLALTGSFVHLVIWPVLGSATFFTGVGMLAYGSTPRIELVARPGAEHSSRRAGPRLTGLGLAPLPGGAAVGLSMEF